jgi:Ser/Thr protein kinase RdoA (MazF antagonist)
MATELQNSTFESLSAEQQLTHLTDVAYRALPYWDLPADTQLTLLSLSENATYKVDFSEDKPSLILRVHRTHYHTRDAIRTELAWMKALQEQAQLETPQAVVGQNGKIIQAVDTPALNEQRYVVLFNMIAGVAPDESHLIEPFKRLGAVTARMHQHARQWQRPEFFERLIWDFDGCLGKVQLWGDWRDGPGLDDQGKVVLETTQAVIEQRLHYFGSDPEHFGLIHADLRLANLLESAGQTRVIDFDDAGLGWFLYDIAGAVSFIETREDLPELIDAWVEGYLTKGTLSQHELDEIPTFIMLRRMTLLAWIASHAETELAQSQGAEFTQGTVMLANDYLKKMTVKK